MEVKIREFQPTDEEFETIAAIGNRIFPDYPESAGVLKHRFAAWDHDKYYFRRYIAEDNTGRIVGWADSNHESQYFAPDRYWLWINVEPELQRQGIGGALYDRILADLRGRNATAMETQAAEKMPAVVEFLTKRGFRETHRDWESRADARDFDAAPFQSYVDQVAQSGIVITTLAEVRDSDPDWLAKLYDLHTTIVKDVPAPTPYTPPGIDEFRRQQIEAPELIAAAYYIARDGDLYVGESFFEEIEEEPTWVYQGYTGVRPEYRHRGIAIALKVATMEYAKAHGYEQVITWNSTVNTGMLAINERMGFVRQPAWIQMETTIE